MADPYSEEVSEQVDRHGVLKTYERWPSLAQQGFELKPGVSKAGFTRGCVMGMGGSAAGGDIISSWLAAKGGPEVSVFKGTVPVEDMTGILGVACSASGQTEETIAMMKTALKRGATVVSLSAGGRLMRVSEEMGIPHMMMPEVVAPRYMLPFIVFASMAVFDAGMGLGCVAEAKDAISELESEWKAVSPSVPLRDNAAKKLAELARERTPVIYGSRVTRGAGIRFKNVLNENSKRHAHFDGLPDAFHNEIEAWEDPATGYMPIFLRHRSEAQWDRTRSDSMVRILQELGRKPVEVRGRGETDLAELATMVYRLDMASYYLSVALRRDPFPTALIDRLKRES